MANQFRYEEKFPTTQEGEFQNHFIFPTTITEVRKPVTQKEKDMWFDAYLRHSKESGVSHDFIGYEKVHNDPALAEWFDVVLPNCLNLYLETIGVNRMKIDLFITKAFFNVTDKASINIHNHAENHISWVYYPHVNIQRHRDIRFYDPRDAHPNEPYSKFFGEHVGGNWTYANARTWQFPVKDGVLLVFPSNLNHDIVAQEGDDGPGLQSFKTKTDLKLSRFCVAGDVMIVRKPNVAEYSRTLPSFEHWRKA